MAYGMGVDQCDVFLSGHEFVHLVVKLLEGRKQFLVQHRAGALSQVAQ